MPLRPLRYLTSCADVRLDSDLLALAPFDLHCLPQWSPKILAKAGMRPAREQNTRGQQGKPQASSRPGLLCGGSKMGAKRKVGRSKAGRAVFNPRTGR